jgi:Na+/proline symporter
MHWIDWLVLALFLAYTLWDGLRHHGSAQDLEGLLLAQRSVSWWAAGLSVMATQASAITFIGTTGQAYMEDMRFLQIYLGLPIAMVILSGTLVPFFIRTQAYTAYELLERRFGLHLRLVTSFMFLFSRGALLGITIAAPAYVLALVLQVDRKSVV